MYYFLCLIFEQNRKKVLFQQFFYRMKLVLPNLYKLLILLIYMSFLWHT